MLNEYTNKWFYDVESFPNFACVTFCEDKTHKTLQFSFGMGYNDLQKLQSFLDETMLLIGFNNLSYDNAVLRYIQAWKRGGADLLCRNLFGLSGRLVNDNHRDDEDIMALRYPRNVFYNWESLDLLKVMAFDRKGISLKQVAVALGHEWIQDLPIPYNHHLSTQEEVDLVLRYNINDVVITEKLFYAIQPQLLLRENIGQIYGVNVMNASDSKMGNIILEHYYRTQFGANIRDLKTKRTKRRSVSLGDCIPSVIDFTSPDLITFKKKLAATVTVAPKFEFSEKIRFRGTEYSFMTGGIHSTEKGCRFDATPEMRIMSCDIGSMYPTCIVLNNIYPRHLGKEFVDVLSTLTADRLAAKKTDKVKAEALKITVNGLFGKLNSDTFWLEDAQAMLRVTIAGQLYILMLVEMLEDVGIHCISANTDGIECQVPANQMQTYYDVCKKWEEKTGFMLEYAEYKHYIKRDVNNYIAITTSGEVKTKGIFVPKIDLSKGYAHPIVAKSLYQYFVNNVPVEKTILDEKDILQFCISKKSGGQFKMEYHKVSGINQIQKTNRFFIATSGGTLQKRNIEKNTLTGLYVGHYVELLNIHDPEKPIEEYPLNRYWYISEAKDIIALIEPPQMNMFDMFAQADYGKRTKMIDIAQMPKAIPAEKRVKESDVRDAARTRNTFDVPPSMLLVTKVDTKYAPAITVYSLSKGTENVFKVDKEAFANASLKAGDVIETVKFDKRPKFFKDGKDWIEVIGEFVWWLQGYNFVTDFSTFKRK